jgi:hypothetical protein
VSSFILLVEVFLVQLVFVVYVSLSNETIAPSVTSQTDQNTKSQVSNFNMNSINAGLAREKNTTCHSIPV